MKCAACTRELSTEAIVCSGCGVWVHRGPEFRLPRYGDGTLVTYAALEAIEAEINRLRDEIAQLKEGKK